MDKADRATDREQELLDEQIRVALGTLADTPKESAYICIDCGEPIPEQRRQAMPGCARCVDCEQLRSERQKQFR